MDIHTHLGRVVASRRGEAAASQLRRQEESKRRLVGCVRRKVTTGFIGALAEFEKAFGHLWGHGKPLADCTDNQQKWRRIWEDCRNAVLDNGNKQVRGVESEVDLYDVLLRTNQLTLPIKEHGNETHV